MKSSTEIGRLVRHAQRNFDVDQVVCIHPERKDKKSQAKLGFFLDGARDLVLDNLAHLFHSLHVDLANPLCRHAVFVGEHLQCFFLIFGEPAVRDDVAKLLTSRADGRRPTASRPQSTDALPTPHTARHGRLASDRSSPPHP